MVSVNLASVIWIAFNAIGLWYALKVWRNSRIDYREVSEYEHLSEEDRTAVLFQARLNGQIAFAKILFMATYLLIGLASIVFLPTNAIYVFFIQAGLIIGDIVAVYIIYQIDNGRTKLRALVGGRRSTDRIALTEDNEDDGSNS